MHYLASEPVLRSTLRRDAQILHGQHIRTPPRRVSFAGTAQRARPAHAMAPSPEQVGLAAGLALAFRQLRANARDAVGYNAHIVGRDKSMILLFLLSGSAFSYITSREGSELKRERRAAAKALPSPPAKDKDGKQVAKAAKPTKGNFWADLRFLISLGLFPASSGAGSAVTSRGGVLLTTQFGLLVMRTLLVRRNPPSAALVLALRAGAAPPRAPRWLWRLRCARTCAAPALRSRVRSAGAYVALAPALRCDMRCAGFVVTCTRLIEAGVARRRCGRRRRTRCC